MCVKITVFYHILCKNLFIETQTNRKGKFLNTNFCVVITEVKTDYINVGISEMTRN